MSLAAGALLFVVLCIYPARVDSCQCCLLHRLKWGRDLQHAKGCQQAMSTCTCSCIGLHQVCVHQRRDCLSLHPSTQALQW